MWMECDRQRLAPITSGRSLPIYMQGLQWELFASKCERKALKSLTAMKKKAQRKEERKETEKEKEIRHELLKKKVKSRRGLDFFSLLARIR
jgi:hypothetical protein